MKRSITRWTLAATAAALLAVPATGAAQTTTPATAQTSSQTSTAAQVPDAAREHLNKAKAALADLQTANLNAKARTQVTELKKRMTALERAVGARDSAPAAKNTANWGTEVAAIDKALTALLGNASTTGATGTTTPPATGTTGATSAAAAGGMTLDEPTRAKLTEIRTHVTAFATAMAGGKTDASPEPSAAAGTTGTATSTTGSSTTGSAATAGTATAGSTTGTAAAGTATTAQQPPATTPPQQQTAQPPQPAASQADEDAARRHLTEARNTLSAMTQLPAAAQLQGEARTQVSQLIANFNELITTQTEWKATYAKLEGNLTALLGPDPAGATAVTSGTAGATGTTGTAGTTGATAGTSGTAPVELDPALREKLVELRRHLNEFEKAAGGTAATPSSTPAAAAAAAPMTSGTTGSTAATSTTDPAASQSMQTAQAGSQDLMKHVAALDALLRMQDDSGGLTLTKAQVEQLRTHWAAIQAALQKR